MKTQTKLIALASMAFAVYGSVDAQAQTNTNPLTHSASTPAYARTIRPIQLEDLEEVNFGAIYASAAGGTVTLVPDAGIFTHGAVRNVSGVSLVNDLVQVGADESADVDDQDGVQEGSVSVMGEAGFHYHITQSPSTVTDGHGHSMDVDQVTFAPTPLALPNYTSTPIPGQLPGNINVVQTQTAVDIVNVGATLHLHPNQAAGLYQGNINLTANYD